MTDLPEHVRRNRAYLDGMADEWVESGRRNWAQDEPHWGVWQIPESDAGLLPDVSDMDVIELGCGTAYVSAWLAKRTPAGRWGEVEELVGAAVFLASDASSFVNGHTLYVDGGMTVSV